MVWVCWPKRASRVPTDMTEDVVREVLLPTGPGRQQGGGDRRDVVRAQARRAQGAALSEPVFRREGDAFVPTGHARGPWDPGQLHGGAPRRADRRGDPGGGLPRRPADPRLPRAGADGAADGQRAHDEARAQLPARRGGAQRRAARWWSARAPCACAAGRSSCRRSPATTRRRRAAPRRGRVRPVPRHGRATSRAFT